jgi:hypothetical protein
MSIEQKILQKHYFLTNLRLDTVALQLRAAQLRLFYVGSPALIMLILVFM